MSEGHSRPGLSWKPRLGFSLRELPPGLMVFAPPGGTVQSLRGLPAPSAVQGRGVQFPKTGNKSYSLSFAASKPRE